MPSSPLSLSSTPKNEDEEESCAVSERSANWATRAARHDLHLPMRYRVEGQTQWRDGKTVNISKSGILFSSSDLLEAQARLEIVFHISGVALPYSYTHRALVVRRSVSNWPDTPPIFGARFSG